MVTDLAMPAVHQLRRVLLVPWRMPYNAGCYLSTRHTQNMTSGTTMSAWQIHKYGGNEQFTLSHTVRVPSINKPDEVLVKVHAASVNPIDTHMRGGYGSVLINKVRKIQGQSASEFPLTLGRDFSGTVVETGKSLSVTKFKPGDEVWGVVGLPKQGAHAQYLVVSAQELCQKPKNLTHTEAACIPYIALTNWSALCTTGGLSAKTAANKRVLIHGGSGGIGTFAIQLMKAWGAEVTTTCSTNAVELVTSMGADVVIDYKTHDVYQELNAIKGFDFILDPIGGDTKEKSVGLLKKNAKYVTILSPLLRNSDQYGAVFGLAKSALTFGADVLQALQSGHKYGWAFFMPNKKALQTVTGLVEDQKIAPVLEKVFPFTEVPAAFEKVAQKHGRGKTVIEIT